MNGLFTMTRPLLLGLDDYEITSLRHIGLGPTADVSLGKFRNRGIDVVIKEIRASDLQSMERQQQFIMELQLWED
jgi:hypothetical protein